MAILKLARMGHPVLVRRAEPVADPTAPAVRRLVADMVETLEDAGGVGLAAPQVHESLRILIFFVPESRGEPVSLTVLINPEVVPVGEEEALDWEGCLSIPHLRGAVPRWQRIRYRGTDLEGRPLEREAQGFHARIVQHEVDHLDGILYPMRMTDLSLLSYIEEWQRYAPRIEQEGK